jgi:hypothetical protein
MRPSTSVGTGVTLDTDTISLTATVRKTTANGNAAWESKGSAATRFPTFRFRRRAVAQRYLFPATTRVEPNAFAARLSAGVTTFAFNANPLIRLDGYYVLSDLIEIPNLAQRQFVSWLSYFVS